MRASFGSENNALLTSEEQSILFGSRAASAHASEHSASHPVHPVACACLECFQLKDLTFRDW